MAYTSIYKGVFGFEDFKYWDGVRFGYRCVPMALSTSLSIYIHVKVDAKKTC